MDVSEMCEPPDVGVQYGNIFTKDPILGKSRLKP